MRFAPAALTLVALAATTGAPSAQGRHVFVADQAASAFIYTGSASYQGIGPAPIQGVPNNSFKLAGTFDLDLTKSGGAVTAGAMVPGGSATTVPQLQAILPNPIPFLPPLATLSITGLSMDFTSVDPVTLLPASFAVVGGNFSTNVVATLLSGTASITAFGSTSNVDLTGSQSPPQFVAGTIAPIANGYQLSIPLNMTFVFNDPGTGASGSLNLVGTVVARYRPLNSTSSSVSIAAGGTQNLILSSGGVLPFNPYIVVGSLAGTAPGIPVGPGLVLPLNLDPFLAFSLANANAPPFSNTFNVLDANGKSTAAFTLPPAVANPNLAGLTINWAYAVIDLGAGAAVGFVSNAEPLLLQP